ncbi:hypothetical protein ACFFX1_24945 [Dactylosporangium sucinum]|uniref:Lipoprotein n=1 Tax=Dactylosporangium sucinum TaxID=1424081 RepID=A0A917T5R0_9ACTN|nr:hypothetical protein [Dactylosporangium sucinum]GGM10207.1 hypothetical protein GCM10007977_009190 [Dactylosporangium sucinum]
MSGHRTALRLAASAAAIAAASLTLGAGPVSAAPETPTVEFSGGSVLSLLVCKSEPSAGSVSVPAESRVNFVNRLGQNATLKVDGKPVSSVQPNQAVPVVFRKGPAVEVAMTFSCGVGVVEQFKPVSIGVTNPPPAPVTKQPATTAPAGNGGGNVTNPTGKVTGGATPTGRSNRGNNGQRSTGEQGAMGTEPVDPSLLGPDATAAPAVGAEPSTPAEDRVLVEQPVAASGPARNAPTGLLALVATVCAVGVGIAAIRAIIAQRSSRASFA